MNEPEVKKGGEETKGIPKHLDHFVRRIGVREAVDFYKENNGHSEFFMDGNPDFYDLLGAVALKLPSLKPDQYLAELGPWKLIYSDSPLIGDIFGI